MRRTRRRERHAPERLSSVITAESERRRGVNRVLHSRDVRRTLRGRDVDFPRQTKEDTKTAREGTDKTKASRAGAAARRGCFCDGGGGHGENDVRFAVERARMNKCLFGGGGGGGQPCFMQEVKKICSD